MRVVNAGLVVLTSWWQSVSALPSSSACRHCSSTSCQLPPQYVQRLRRPVWVRNAERVEGYHTRTGRVGSMWNIVRVEAAGAEALTQDSPRRPSWMGVCVMALIHARAVCTFSHACPPVPSAWSSACRLRVPRVHLVWSHFACRIPTLCCHRFRRDLPLPPLGTWSDLRLRTAASRIHTWPPEWTAPLPRRAHTRPQSVVSRAPGGRSSRRASLTCTQRITLRLLRPGRCAWWRSGVTPTRRYT
jgi:hypothetical protein